MSEENACTILRRLIVDEEKAPQDYEKLYDKLAQEQKTSSPLAALFDKIISDEKSHKGALQRIEGLVCGEGHE